MSSMTENLHRNTTLFLLTGQSFKSFCEVKLYLWKKHTTSMIFSRPDQNIYRCIYISSALTRYTIPALLKSLPENDTGNASIHAISNQPKPHWGITTTHRDGERLNGLSGVTEQQKLTQVGWATLTHAVTFNFAPLVLYVRSRRRQLPRTEPPTIGNLWWISSGGGAEKSSGVTSEPRRHHQPGGRRSLRVQPARSTWRRAALQQQP